VRNVDPFHKLLRLDALACGGALLDQRCVCGLVWSIWPTASQTWSTPELCSTLAELISPTTDVTRSMLLFLHHSQVSDQETP
jgi:hypothetical protein